MSSQSPEPPTTPDPVCQRCSKPVELDTGVPVAGGVVHLRCLAEETRYRVVETQDRASHARARARTVTERAERLFDQASALLGPAPSKRLGPVRCPVCTEPLANGHGVLFQGEELVHAACWRSEPRVPPAAS
jgi:hypothetical protein